jgi:predicted phage terminase large subunit-like protein
VSTLNWTLLPWQIECWQDPSRFKVIAAGRRCGKSNFAIKQLLAHALEAPKGSAVLYVAPTLGQARQICWDSLLEQGGDLIKNSNINNLDITLTTGVKIHVRSGENPDSLRGLKLYFVVVDEAAFIKPDVWAKIIRPALSDLKGSAIFISTPDGRNYFYDMYMLGQSGEDPDWKSWHLTTLDNPTIDPAEIEAARRTLSSWQFKVEFESSFDNAGSGIFLESWWKEGKEPQDGSWYIAFDLAGFADVKEANTAAKKRLDRTAIAIVKGCDDGTWYVHKIIMGRWNVEQTALKIIEAVKEYKPIKVGCERGMAKNAVVGYLTDMMRRTGTYFSVQELTHSNQKKTDRITFALQGRMEHGRLVFNEDEDWTDVKEEFFLFGAQGIHDDGVDALAYINQMYVAGFSAGEVELDSWEPTDWVAGY